MTPSSSLANYKRNFLDNFSSHAQKIKVYKANIYKTFGKKAEIWFIIEDASPFGSSYIKRRKDFSSQWLGFHPFVLKEFINLLENTKELSGVIFANSHDQTLQVIFNRSGVIKNLRKNAVDIEERDFMDFTPNIVGVTARISKKRQ
jgi:hypothetical protein